MLFVWCNNVDLSMHKIAIWYSGFVAILVWWMQHSTKKVWKREVCCRHKKSSFHSISTLCTMNFIICKKIRQERVTAAVQNVRTCIVVWMHIFFYFCLVKEAIKQLWQCFSCRQNEKSLPTFSLSLPAQLLHSHKVIALLLRSGLKVTALTFLFLVHAPSSVRLFQFTTFKPSSIFDVSTKIWCQTFLTHYLLTISSARQ